MVLTINLLGVRWAVTSRLPKVAVIDFVAAKVVMERTVEGLRVRVLAIKEVSRPVVFR